MGYLKHHAIVVTDWSDKTIYKARDKAVEIFEAKKEGYSRIISEVIGSVINTQCSFFIAPDGSKEGWSDSDMADEARNEFLDWIVSSHCFCDYVLVSFGGDDEYVTVERDKDSDLDKFERDNA